MTYDNTCKYLAEQYPQEFVNWLLPESAIDNIQILRNELNAEPILADSLTFLQTNNQILHIEFQTIPASDPPLPLRMLDYWVRLYRQYRCPIQQVIIFLKSTNSEAVFINQFESDNTNHRYRVIRLWEQDSAPFLSNIGLLPLATLTRTNSPETLLEEVANRVARIESTTQRQTLAFYTGILAGLRFDKSLINQLLREETMEESVIYQQIIEKGQRKGEVSLLLRQLTRKLGTIPSELQVSIQRLSIQQLEELGEALFDFSTVGDLSIWLSQNTQ